MPEGVEIYIQINKLRPKCIGKTIVEIKWNSNFQKNGVKTPEIVALPLKVIDIWSRGKVIVFETLDRNNTTLYITSQLGMSGQWIFEPQDHSNLWISFGDPSLSHPGFWKINETIWYDDMRRFGSINFCRDLADMWKRHGPCLMLTTLVNNGDISPKNLKEDQKLVSLDMYSKEIKNKRFKSKRIAEFMMDQTRVAGVGNYLRAEILYQARISPERMLTSLSDADIKLLYESTLDVMYRSYISKGKYHAGKDCGSGFKMLVYKQNYDPNGYNVVTFPDKNNRMCYFVPEIQK